MKRLISIALLIFLAGLPISSTKAYAGDITLMAVGDILPHPSWQPLQIPTPKLFEGVVSTLFEANIVIGNLESPLTDKSEPTSTKTDKSVTDKKNFVFKAESDDTAKGLRDAGFTVLTLANNHMLDFREEGLLDTLARLKTAGIKYAGAGGNRADADSPCVAGPDWAPFVIISASDVVPKGFEAKADKAGISSMKDDNAFIKRVSQARAKYPKAVLVLSLHWGTEATYIPTVRQKTLAHRLIDAGADLIIGHHPHRIQGVEFYKDRPIFYSLGNFQFDTNPPGDESIIARLVYKDGSRTPSTIAVKPVKIANGGIPNVLEPGSQDYRSIMDRLGKLCAPFGLKLDGEDLVSVPSDEKSGYDYWGT
jgi:Bacterial capsule synthesis protein PGA_cap